MQFQLFLGLFSISGFRAVWVGKAICAVPTGRNAVVEVRAAASVQLTRKGGLCPLKLEAGLLLFAVIDVCPYLNKVCS